MLQTLEMTSRKTQPDVVVLCLYRFGFRTNTLVWVYTWDNIKKDDCEVGNEQRQFRRLLTLS